jgi:hypothetical protein
MKKLLLTLILVLVLPVVAWIGIADAQSFRSGTNITVPRGQSLNSSLWAGGTNIEVAGTVNGDVICGGQDINVSGTVNGDVICAGQNVRVSGEVNGDVRLAGQTVTISSEISGSATVASQSFTLDESARIGRDLSVAGQNTNVNGQVERDVAFASGVVVLSNQVGRDVRGEVAELTLTPDARVGGDLRYASQKRADIQNGATVDGTTQRTEPKKSEGVKVAFVGLSWLFALYMIVSLLLLAFVLTLLMPQLFYRISGNAVREPLKSVLVGFVANLALPVLFLALLFTVFGIPLALLLLLSWLLITFFGYLFFSFYIGRLILRDRSNAIGNILLGGFVVLVLWLIPVVGYLVWLAALWFGTGMILMELWNRYQRPQYKLVEEKVTRQVADTVPAAKAARKKRA